jgi:A/G-specific adenine glycosylase
MQGLCRGKTHALNFEGGANWQTTTAPPPATSTEDQCDLCAPIPSTSETTTIPAVTIFPMRKEKKVSRVEDEVVCITEWRYQGKRSWLFVKRPEKGKF